MQKKRVVITGAGLVSPIGNNLADFEMSLHKGISGIKFIKELSDLNFGCTIAGLPDVSVPHEEWFHKYGLTVKSNAVSYVLMSGIEAWESAGFHINLNENPDPSAGCIMGTGYGGIDVFLTKVKPAMESGNIKKMGSAIIENWMPSGPATFLSAALGLGNQVACNSAACSTGTEAIIMAYERIISGKATIMLAGGVDIYSPWAYAGFDAMRLLCRKFNDAPEQGSRPMSQSASGFVPGAGAGVIVLEDYETALKRNAPVMAEITGGFINSGGQRNGGSATAPNPMQAKACMAGAMKEAGINGNEVDLISGHLTSTMADPIEVANWAEVLQRKGKNFPFINSLKSMTGHLIGAAGAVETIATLLQIKNNFVHPSLNCEDVHTEISNIIDTERIPKQAIFNAEINCAMKISLGFGDVNSCLVLKKFNS
jgi:3-oxoacyl-[acyl-carrier-protein] synthase I